MAKSRQPIPQQAQNQGVSCEMCLLADEPSGMLHIEVQRPDGATIRTAVLCRRCVTAILAAAQAVVESEREDEPDESA